MGHCEPIHGFSVDGWIRRKDGMRPFVPGTAKAIMMVANNVKESGAENKPKFMGLLVVALSDCTLSSQSQLLVPVRCMVLFFIW